jgi:transposase
VSRYSNDLRLKVTKFFKQTDSDGTPIHSKSETCKTFDISRPTLNFWLEIQRKGSLIEIKQFQHGRLSSVNLEELKKYIDENPDQYYHEIAKKFSISKSQIHRIVTQKLGYTSKKNKQFIVKRIKKQKPNFNKK